MTLRIKEIAKSKDISLEALANHLEMNRVSLSRIINGNPTIESLQKIATALEVPLKDLFKSDQEKPIYIKRKDGTFEQIGVLHK